MLSFVSIVLIVLSASTSIYCTRISYDNYKVFRIVPINNQQIQALRKLGSKQGYSFWVEPHFPERIVDLLVAPTQLNEFYEEMNNAGIQHNLMIENVQDLINNEVTAELRAGDSVFDFEAYHRLEQIYSWMDMLTLVFPTEVQKLVIGHSFQGREIAGIKLSFGMPKPAIFIEGGMHPREWISPATVVYLIDQLLSSKDPKVRDLAERYDWYIFPVCNPDGYEYTHTDDRLWRKSVSDTGMGSNPQNANCKGVDLNRNFGYKWKETSHLHVDDPCHERYAGSRAFSEIETRTLATFVDSLSGKLMAYISFHSYQQLLLIPYCHTNEHLDNYDDAFTIGSKALQALYGRYGTEYRLGSIAELFYSTHGTSMDWAKGIMGIELAFTYEMRDRGDFGFFLPSELIIPNSEEILDSLIAMFREARRLDYPIDKSIGRYVDSNVAGPSGSGESSRTKKKGIFRFLKCVGG